MAYNFKRWDRGQLMLLPPDISAWLADDHLAMFVLDAVDQLDLASVYASRRADGWGRAAYHPQMMVTLLIYSYCVGRLSSRKIEKGCRDELPFRVICANQVPDHTTICRFRQDFAGEVQQLFVQVLLVCHQAGLADLGTVALDGTKIAVDAALKSNRTYRKLCQEFDETVAALLAKAAETDAAEDVEFGADRRGDELPAELADPRSRVARLAAAKQVIEDRAAAAQAAYQQRLGERGAEEEARGSKLRGRKPKDPGDTPDPDARANVTDPQSRIMTDGHGNYVQGYNGQAIVNKHQVVVAADLTDEANDVHQLHAMLALLSGTLDAAGIDDRPDTVLADAGYCSTDNLEQLDSDGPDVIVATTKRHKLDDANTDNTDDDGEADGEADDQDLPPAPDGPDATDDTGHDEGDGHNQDGPSLVEQMAYRLANDEATREAYNQRGWMVEPLFGQVKAARGIRTFSRRGLDACRSEWLMILACHNLLKLWRHGPQNGPEQPPGPDGPDGSGLPGPRNVYALAA